MPRSVRQLAAAGGTAVLLLATGASASDAMTIKLGTPKLSAHVTISAPVTVSCDPFDPSLTHFGSTATVSVEQAAGTATAHGTGSSFGALPTLLYPCDSADHTITVNVTADPNGPPFHGGPAVFSASADAEAGIPCSPDTTGCFFNVVGQSAMTGPTKLNLH